MPMVWIEKTTYDVTFLFHTRSIKSSIRIGTYPRFLKCFDSILVRLKAYAEYHEEGTESLCFDSTLVRLKVGGR